MFISSWNVNSLKVRLPQVLQYLQTAAPDVLGVQELKQMTVAVDSAALQNLGYHCAIFGQKTYNGVAIFSRSPMSDVVMGIPNFPDDQARAIAATAGGVRILNLYVPNGKAVGDEKYRYKLRWLAAVRDYIEQILKTEQKLIVMGDFNIAPSDLDIFDPAAWANGILCSPPERQALSDILQLGLRDAFRVRYPDVQAFSWWDYRLGGFAKNRGLRIDFTLAGPAIKIIDAGIDVTPRTWQRPSDHTPVWIQIKP